MIGDTGSGETRRDLLAALAWQLELGADEAIAETPVDRFAATDPVPAQALTASVPSRDQKPSAASQPDAAGTPAPLIADPSDAAMDAAAAAAAAETREDLAAAMRAQPSPLSETARNFCFADGRPGAPVMIIGEAPGADEDRLGKPFVGRAGQLLDKMLAAIGLARDAEDLERAVYITNIMPWRPPGNRTPTPAESAVFLPFVAAHVRLAQPRILLTIGNTPTKALLETETGIKRMRGNWATFKPTNTPVLPSFHPAYLLRQPADKRLAWSDLLMLRAALDRET